MENPWQSTLSTSLWMCPSLSNVFQARKSIPGQPESSFTEKMSMKKSIRINQSTSIFYSARLSLCFPLVFPKALQYFEEYLELFWQCMAWHNSSLTHTAMIMVQECLYIKNSQLYVSNYMYFGISSSSWKWMWREQKLAEDRAEGVFPSSNPHICYHVVLHRAQISPCSSHGQFHSQYVRKTLGVRAELWWLLWKANRGVNSLPSEQ